MIFRIVCALILTLGAQARWATREDAAIIREIYNEKITVNEDGTSTTVCEIQELIAKDAAREYAAGFRVSYNENIQKLTILEAKTVFQGKTYKVPKDKIEDKPLASSPYGFDQVRQVMIAFPKAEVGAKIYLKYKLEQKKVPIPGSFSGYYSFGDSWAENLPTYWERACVKVKSKILLYIKVNDPDEVLKVSGVQTQPVHTFFIELVKPLSKSVVNEPQGSLLNPKNKCWVSVSSFTSWAQAAEKEAKDYAVVMNQPLPEKYRAILETAEQKKGDIAQINEVTTLLISQIQYMGDWKSIEGKRIPRSLKTVVQTGLGDCKDFTAGVGAILRNMGYEVYPILVWRHDLYYSEDALYNPIANHVLLKVIGKDGKVYWVDPTNFVSMAGGVFPDVAGKMVIVLNPKNPIRERIPEVNLEHSQVHVDLDMEIKHQKILEVSGVLILQGECALSDAGKALNLSPQAIAEQFFYAITGAHLRPEEKKFLELPDLKSREVKELIYKFAYENPNRISKNNRGVGMRLNADSLLTVTAAIPDQVNDLFIGIPFKMTTKMRLKNGPIDHVERLNYSIKTPWMEMDRVCVNKGEGSEIVTTISILKRYIPAADLKTEQYLKLKEALDWNMEGVSLIFDEAQVSEKRNFGGLFGNFL